MGETPSAADELRPEHLRPLLALVARQAGASRAALVCRNAAVTFPEPMTDEAVAALRANPHRPPDELAALLGTRSVAVHPLEDGAIVFGGDAVALDPELRAACDSLCRQLVALAPDSSTLQLRAVIGAATDGISVQRRDGKVLYVNDALARISGYDDAESLKGAPAQEIRQRFQLTNEDGTPFDWAALPGRVAVATGQPAERTVRFRRASGEERMTLLRASPVRGPDGAVQYVVNFVVDLTERKRSEDALRLLAQAGLLLNRATTLQQGSDELAQLIAQRPGWTVLLEWTGPDGAGLRACVGPDCDAIDRVASPMRVQAGLSPSGRVVLAARRPAAPFGEVEKQLVEEIAGRMQIAIERNRLTEQLAKSLRAREMLMHAVGHELNNPLALVMINAEQIGRWAAQGPDSARLRECAEGITAGVQRMQRLISELVDFIQSEAGKLKLDVREVHVDTLFADARRMMAVVAGDALGRLSFEAPAGLRVRADRGRIAQVLENLLSNAFKYAPEGPITVRAEAAGPEVRFFVTDQGPGIPAADLPNLFEPYWQAPGNARTGLGLGLPICRFIVQAHGGQLWVDSSTRGCTFGFALARA